jgi:hypothetical protein
MRTGVTAEMAVFQKLGNLFFVHELEAMSGIAFSG